MKPAIAQMAEPSANDMARSAIVAAYTAREHLSESERFLTSREDEGLNVFALSEQSQHVHQAASLIEAAYSMFCEHQRRNQLGTNEDVQLSFHRALRAAMAAKEQGHLAAAYADRVNTSTCDPDFAYKQSRAGMMRFRKATESARQDAHRALAELCEVLPDAYDRIDVE